MSVYRPRTKIAPGPDGLERTGLGQPEDSSRVWDRGVVVLRTMGLESEPRRWKLEGGHVIEPKLGLRRVVPESEAWGWKRRHRTQGNWWRLVVGLRWRGWRRRGWRSSAERYVGIFWVASSSRTERSSRTCTSWAWLLLQSGIFCKKSSI